MSHAVVFSEYNILSSHLVEFLLGSKCRVSIVCSGKSTWKEHLPHFEENEHLAFLSSSQSLGPNISYAFVVAGVGPNPYGEDYALGIERQYEEAFTFIGQSTPKAVLFLPLYQNTAYQQKAVSLSQKAKVEHLINITTVYTPELYGTRMSFEENLPVTKMIKETVFSSTVSIPENNFDVYYAYVDDFVAEVVGRLFSFGFEKSEFALAQSSSTNAFFENLQSLKNGLSPVKDAGINPPKIVSGMDLVGFTQSKPNSLGQTLEWLATYAPPPQSLTREAVRKIERQVARAPIVKARPPRRFTARGIILTSLILLFWLFCLPFISLLGAAGLLKFAYHTATQGNFSTTQKLLTVSGKLAGFSRSGFAVISATPGLGRKLVFARETASVVALSSQAAGHGVELAQTGTQLVAGILGEKEYDLPGLSGKLSRDLESLHQEMTFLGRELANLPSVVQSALPKDLDPTRLAEEIKVAQTLSQRLPVLLGSQKTTTYLVLLQNNMELRPTGGFIGSFALVTVEKGRLINLEVNDVYSADGQLKGHVEPPTPIKEYLGEANWYLRDSNWDPDFPQAATKAEWFLEKEIERPVDGVVGIDLEMAKKILSVTGPITLTDFNQEINAQNMYEKVQYEVESDFFPGSRKKANFLTSLSRVLLSRITHAQKGEYLSLAKVLYESLKERHLQFYLHDEPTAKSLLGAGWDGGVAPLSCGIKNCQSLLVGVVEANVGVNKANYFVKREADYNISFVGSQVVVKQTVTLVNTANPALGLAGKYKAYLRVLAPGAATFETVEISDSQGVKYQEADFTRLESRSEAGVVVDISPGAKKKITFTYRLPLTVSFASPGEVLLLVRKQAGTEADLFKGQIGFPGAVKSFGWGSLTQGAQVGYNTSLREDIKARFSW